MIETIVAACLWTLGICTVIMVILAIIGHIIKRSSKCKFDKHCNLYQLNDDVCNKSNGNAYGTLFEFRPGGCYRDLELNGKNSKYWKK